MKGVVNIVRILVGVLFIVSGLVKTNDPLGLSYKMQEFFEIWNADLAASTFFAKGLLINFFLFLHNNSLALSIIMITLEIVAGVALLIGWSKRFVLNLLLILIVFFTFLTAYAYLSGKFKNCGCFGDCLPITPLTSFLKDVVLLALIVFLIANKKYLLPVSSINFRRSVLLSSLLLSVLLQWYVLNYLPIADCLPFKKGNNISQQMKIPTGAVPDSFAIRFVYEKGGKQFEFSSDGLPNDLDTYTYVDRVDKLIRKGNAEPPIKGFALIGLNMDSTKAVLNQPTALLLFAEKFASDSWMNDLKELSALAQSKNLPVYISTSAPIPATSEVLHKNGIQNVQVFSTDNTVVKTAARTNPTLLVLQKGTIIKKYSKHELDDALDDLKKM